jgi:tripartite-type tricarboxylate transporter receptor subunit TctC
MKDVVCGRRNLLHIPALFRRPAVERAGGTPPAVVKRIQDDVAEVLNMPAVRKRMNEIGGEPKPTSSEEFTRWVRLEIERWNRVAKAAGIEPQ